MGSSDISIRQTNKFDDVVVLNALIMPEDDIDVSSNTFHWIARDKHSGKQVGFCSVTDCGDGVLFLSRCGVLRNYRGRGTQKRFIAIREQFAKRRGFEAVVTYTLKDNYQSMVNLIKSGYEIYSPEYSWVGANVIYYRKKLCTAK